jgi:hypothetical protein
MRRAVAVGIESLLELSEELGGSALGRAVGEVEDWDMSAVIVMYVWVWFLTLLHAIL